MIGQEKKEVVPVVQQTDGLVFKRGYDFFEYNDSSEYNYYRSKLSREFFVLFLHEPVGVSLMILQTMTMMTYHIVSNVGRFADRLPSVFFRTIQRKLLHVG